MKKVFMSALLCIVLSLFAETCAAQGNLQFNQIKLISASAESVPEGKAWKVVNVYVPQALRFSASSGSGSCTGSCNGGTTRWNSFTVASCPDMNANAQLRINGAAVVYNVSADIWLPAGTSVQGNEYSCNSSTGFFNGTVNGVTYNCFCPTNAPVVSVVSVIEFNIIDL